MKTTAVQILLACALFASCSKDNSPSGPGSTSSLTPEQQQAHTHVLAVNSQAANLFQSLIASKDTASALDSVAKVIVLDTAVQTATASSQGLAIQFKSGIRGGLFIDPEDGGQNSLGLKTLGRHHSGEYVPDIQVLPSSRQTVFLNPSYHERKQYADPLLDSCGVYYPKGGYAKPRLYLDDKATIAAFTSLSGYGIIHMYSHGKAFPSNKNIVDIYMLTGEKVSEATSAKWWAMLLLGEIAIFKYQGADYYWLTPTFLTSANNFSKDTVLVYGGFCYSYLGGWPETITQSIKAGAYVGFDWSVYTRKNAEWANVLYKDLCDTVVSPAWTIGDWFTRSGYSKSYYNSKANRYVAVHYRGRPDLSLIPAPLSLSFTKCDVFLGGVWIYYTGNRDSSYSAQSWNVTGGTVTNGFFHGVREDTSHGWRHEINATLDPETGELKTFDATYTYTSDVTSSTTTFAIVGTNLPLDTVTVNDRFYYASGTSLSSHITKLEDKNSVFWSSTSWVCTEQSWLRVWFSK